MGILGLEIIVLFYPVMKKSCLGFDFQEQGFYNILSKLHAGDLHALIKSKFCNKLCASFQKSFYQLDKVSTDKYVVKWQGHWKSKQNNLSKPVKYRYHVKMFGLCHSTTG